MKSRCILFGIAACLAACTTGPDYKPPKPTDSAMPAEWKIEAPFRLAEANDQALKGDWWELFQDAQLTQLIQQALVQNQNLAAASARLQQARAQVNISESGLFPQVSTQLGAQRLKISADRPLAAYNTVNQETVQNNFQLGFAVNYEADLFGRVRKTVESARASAQQARADFENLRLVLLSELAADYFNLRELDAEIKVVSEAIRLQERALQFISDRHALGAASGLDLAQQEALLDANKTQLELLQKQRVQFEHALATVTGTPAPLFSLAPGIIDFKQPVLPVGLPSEVLQRRPDIASAERAMAVANANIGVARAAYFPSIMLQPNGGWDSNQLSSLFNAPSILWSLGASVTQTIFDAGKTRATVSIAESGYLATAANYRQSVLVAMQEVQDGVQGLALLERAGHQAQASVRSAQKVLDLANERYRGGVSTYLDVITAQQSLLADQRQLVQIQGQQMLTTVYLIKALGGGWTGMKTPEN